jgi:hypothetical protein
MIKNDVMLLSERNGIEIAITNSPPNNFPKGQETKLIFRIEDSYRDTHSTDNINPSTSHSNVEEIGNKKDDTQVTESAAYDFINNEQSMEESDEFNLALNHDYQKSKEIDQDIAFITSNVMTNENENGKDNNEGKFISTITGESGEIKNKQNAAAATSSSITFSNGMHPTTSSSSSTTSIIPSRSPQNEVEEKYNNNNSSSSSVTYKTPTWEILTARDRGASVATTRTTTIFSPLERIKNEGGSSLECFLGEGHVNIKKKEYDVHQMCLCKNCCYDQDKIVVFDSPGDAFQRLKRIVPGVGTAKKSIEFNHVPYTKLSNNRSLMKQWEDALWIEKPTHLLTHMNERTMHPLFIQYVMANTLQEWNAYGWLDKDDFNWAMIGSNIRVESMNSWLTELHPKNQLILRTVNSIHEKDKELKKTITSNYNTKVCFAESMIGYRKKSDVWVGHGSNRKAGKYDGEHDFDIPAAAPVDIWKRFATYINDKRGVSVVATVPRKAIYLTREDSQRRRVTNRHQVYNLLKEKGFEVEVLILSDYLESIGDAHKKLHSASLIIGPHGAGFANIIAFNPDAAVIEFHAEQFQRIVYGKMAAVLGMKYNALLVPAKDLKHTTASKRVPEGQNDFYRHQDMKVSIQSLDIILQEVEVYLKEKNLW